MNRFTGILSVLMLGCFTATGVSAEKAVLTPANYKQKFDEVEKLSKEKPGTLDPKAVEKILGKGEKITNKHADLADGPAGFGAGVEKWTRWAGDKETLIVGYTGDLVSSVIRYRR